MTPRRFAFGLAAFVAGAVVWALLAAATGVAEPWDGPVYWSVGLPLTWLIVAVLAWIEPDGAMWRGVLPFLGQFTWMVARAPDASLWPLGLAMFVVISLPGVVAAWGIARARRRRGAGQTAGGSAE